MKKPAEAAWEFVLCPMCLSGKVLSRTWVDPRTLCLRCEEHGAVVTLQLVQSRESKSGQ